jgi:hypothetical protein
VTAVPGLADWPERAARAFALGLPLEGQDTEPECAQVLSQAEQLVHDVLAQEPGLSKRQLALRLQGRLHRALVREVVDHGAQHGWCQVQPGPRTAHALYLRCCGTTADAQRTVRREQPDPARPWDGYDALRLRMPVLVLQDLLATAPGEVVEAYDRVWRQGRAPRRQWDEQEVRSELGEVQRDLLTPAVALLEEAGVLLANVGRQSAEQGDRLALLLQATS